MVNRPGSCRDSTCPNPGEHHTIRVQLRETGTLNATDRDRVIDVVVSETLNAG
jgi:hypothetical protein